MKVTLDPAIAAIEAALRQAECSLSVVGERIENFQNELEKDFEMQDKLELQIKSYKKALKTWKA